ncbi:hypothetical protein [Novosphingobium sp. Chol11]|uniref:hypothetical protein n=1 Tax=Novosphingobium sp. Chol11 TaxID=1385763 RepID=UPI0025F203FA|nr:hypothetical protein [Novosphingobium sp. Chol11]
MQVERASAQVGEDGTYSGTMYGGRYVHKFVAHGGEWRISKRDDALDWSLPLPMLEILASEHPQYRVM